MPYCKNCHKEIRRFDNDVCPYCGTPHPISEGYETMDITRGFSSLEGNYELPKAKSRKTAILFCATLGIFGVHQFYLGFAKKGLFYLLLTFILIGGIGSLFLFAPIHPIIGYLVMFGLDVVYHLIEALALAKADSPKDGKGDFIR